jgi:hypothetical protein
MSLVVSLTFLQGGSGWEFGKEGFITDSTDPLFMCPTIVLRCFVCKLLRFKDNVGISRIAPDWHEGGYVADRGESVCSVSL